MLGHDAEAQAEAEAGVAAAAEAEAEAGAEADAIAIVMVVPCCFSWFKDRPRAQPSPQHEEGGRERWLGRKDRACEAPRGG